MAHNSAGRSSLHRSLQILSAFESHRPYLTFTELVEASSLPPSTVNRLAAELTAEGLLERLPDRRYRLGVRLWEFASKSPTTIGLREAARPALAAIHARIRQHVQLGVRSGTDVVFLDRLSHPDAVVNATLLGARLPVYRSCLGLVLLAGAAHDDAIVAEAERRLQHEPPERGARNPAELRRALRDVSRDGWAVTRGWIYPASRGIAVPVHNADGSVIAAIAVVVPNDGGPDQPYVELLRWASAHISQDRDEARRYDESTTGGGGIDPSLMSGVSEHSLRYFEQKLGGHGRT